MSLQTDYRPKSLKALIGNSEVKSSIASVIEREKPPSAFLFTGPSGCGKTTLGRIVKTMLNCSDADYKELNASDDRKLTDMRKLIESMRFSPLSGNKKIFLLDEAHMIRTDAQEALLKALEEPPEYVHWIICTTNPEVFKPTFKRRCHIYELKALTYNELHKLLQIVLKKEGKENYSEKVCEVIIDMADGSAGQALKLLDMVIDMKDEKRAITTIKASGYGPGGEDVNQIVKILSHGTMPQKTKWLKIKNILKDYKGDGESVRRPILGYLSAILLNNGGEEIFFMMEPFQKNFYDSGKAGLVMACYEAIFGFK